MRRLEAQEAAGTGLLDPPPEMQHLFRPPDEGELELNLLDIKADNGDASSSSMDSKLEEDLREQIRKDRERDNKRREEGRSGSENRKYTGDRSAQTDSESGVLIQSSTRNPPQGSTGSSTSIHDYFSYVVFTYMMLYAIIGSIRHAQNGKS
ncbi:hypothetical protein AAMO2058_000946400 [Amorphochlora amoebiformis]